MQRFTLLFIGTALVMPAVSGQTMDAAAAACERRCHEVDHEGPGIEPYDQKLAQIRAHRKADLAPQERARIEAEEKRAIERRDVFVGGSCRYICNGK